MFPLWGPLCVDSRTLMPIHDNQCFPSGGLVMPDTPVRPAGGHFNPQQQGFVRPKQTLPNQIPDLIRATDIQMKRPAKKTLSVGKPKGKRRHASAASEEAWQSFVNDLLEHSHKKRKTQAVTGPPVQPPGQETVMPAGSHLFKERLSPGSRSVPSNILLSRPQKHHPLKSRSSSHSFHPYRISSSRTVQEGCDIVQPNSCVRELSPRNSDGETEYETLRNGSNSEYSDSGAESPTSVVSEESPLFNRTSALDLTMPKASRAVTNGTEKGHRISASRCSSDDIRYSCHSEDRPLPALIPETRHPGRIDRPACRQYGTNTCTTDDPGPPALIPITDLIEDESPMFTESPVLLREEPLMPCSALHERKRTATLKTPNDSESTIHDDSGFTQSRLYAASASNWTNVSNLGHPERSTTSVETASKISLAGMAEIIVEVALKGKTSV